MRRILTGATAVCLLGFFLLYANSALGEPPVTISQAMDLDKAGKHDQAVAALKKIIDSGTEQPKAYLSLGLVYFKSGEYDRALENFELSVAIRRDNPMAYYFTGMIYEKKALGTPNADIAREMKTQALKSWQNYLSTVGTDKEHSDANRNIGIPVSESIRRAQKHIEILQEGLRYE